MSQLEKINCLAFPDKEEQVIAVNGRVCLEQKVFEKLNYLRSWRGLAGWAKMWNAMIGNLEEKMSNKEIGPVGCVVSDGESGVLTEASQLFPAFKKSQTQCLWLYDLPPLKLDLIEKLFKGCMISAPGHLGLPQLLGQHDGGEGMLTWGTLI